MRRVWPPASTVAAPAIAQSMPEVKWRLTSSFPKSLDTLYGGSELFAKMIGEMSDGKFQVRAFAAGEIVPGLQVADAVQNGTVEAGQTAAYYYFGKHVNFVFETGLPFTMNQREYYAWLLFRRRQRTDQRVLQANTTSAPSSSAARAARWAAGSARKSSRWTT